MKTLDEVVQEYEILKNESEDYLDRYGRSGRDSNDRKVQHLEKYARLLELLSHLRRLHLSKDFQFRISLLALCVYEPEWRTSIVLDYNNSEGFIVYLQVGPEEAHLHPYMMKKFKLSELEAVLEEYVDLAK
ncbi:MAG: hypothetical protein L0154_14730 [Chloroflexi bacterium]|nr:hypothetical protein [Chloroflexota bacterium]